MSGFVPMGGASTFSAGVLGEGAGPREKEAPKAFSTTAEKLTDAGAAERAGSVMASLPESQEALDALLDAAREQARVDAGAVLAGLRKEVEAEREQLLALQENVLEGRAAWAQEVRNVLGELVVVGVRQVVGESATLQDELLRDRFAEIGERLVGEKGIVIRVRPEDEAVARALVGDREGWSIATDSDLSGGVVAETESGKIDATLGAALTGLNEAVQEWQAEGVLEE
jgi:flagellar biosynthesis/type III secretory pathway protein FliH